MMLRDVMRAAWARMQLDWSQTSHLMWMLYEVHRSDKSPQRSPKNFNPLLQDD